MNEEELRKEIAKAIEAQNNRGIPEFKGYSPKEFESLLYDPFGPESPIKLNRLSEEDCERVPVLNQIVWLMDLLKSEKGIKLTSKGNLPVKVVAEVYARGPGDDGIERGISKLYKETDSDSVHFVRIILEVTGLTRKRKGVLYLTKEGEKLHSDRNALLQRIFSGHTQKFNWAYFDYSDDDGIGQRGFGFSLILLSLYGDMRRSAGFYAEEYFKAFPMLLENLMPRYGTKAEQGAHVWTFRTVKRFLHWYGLVRVEDEVKNYERLFYITATDLFNRFITCTPPKSIR